MTSKNEEYPPRFLWLWERGFIAFMIVGALILAAIILFGVTLNNRLGNIENQFVYSPPNRYVQPDLASYSAGEVNADDLPVRRWIYVPSYSHIYADDGSPYPLATTLSIRNIDVDQPIYLKSVQYFDTDGNLVKSYSAELIKLRPLQTIEFLVERRDSSGGSGSNFLLEWLSDEGVDQPVFKSVMVGTTGTQGICFSESGIEVSEPTRNRPANPDSSE